MLSTTKRKSTTITANITITSTKFLHWNLIHNQEAVLSKLSVIPTFCFSLSSMTGSLNRQAEYFSLREKFKLKNYLTVLPAYACLHYNREKQKNPF